MTSIDTTDCYHDIPEPLKLLCLRKAIKGMEKTECFSLPHEISELIADAFRKYAIANRLNQESCDKFYRSFKQRNLPLKKINFSSLPISSELFIEFLEEYKDWLQEVNIMNCDELGGDVSYLRKLNSLLKTTKTNKSLIIGSTFSSIIHNQPSADLFDHDLRLSKLVLHELFVDAELDAHDYIDKEFTKILTPSLCQSLTYLELTKASILRGSFLPKIANLETLILYNSFTGSLEFVSNISQLKKLRILDLSLAVESDGDEWPEYEYEEYNFLKRLILDLPGLTWLDISGRITLSRDLLIQALEPRQNRPFEFLGLFQSTNEAACRSDIPAKIIASEASESQIINACEAFINKPRLLTKALNELYNLYRITTPGEKFEHVNRALEVVLPVLSKHLVDDQLIILATAALWCIVKINVTTKSLNCLKVRRTITSRLLDAMHYHTTNQVILINGSLTLLFLPDIICEHSRLASISLSMCRNSDTRTQGFGTTLLNTLACQVGGDQKVYIGTLNAIETMVDIITSKISNGVCDEILEAAWSTLWNITDETPVNCRKFLESNGLDAFEHCMDKFINNKEVQRNIMGLLGNVAEVPELREYFMKERYIRRFYYLLSGQIDGIECSYNACGIFAHLVSEGQHFWETHMPEAITTGISREKVLEGMRTEIPSWPINSKRNINYRSFEPIVKLLDPHITAEAQYWAVFALTNLTRINPEKYCSMLIPHGGLKKLRRLAIPSVTEPFVTKLAQIAVIQWERFNEEGGLGGLDQTDSLDPEVVRTFCGENRSDSASEMDLEVSIYM